MFSVIRALRSKCAPMSWTQSRLASSDFTVISDESELVEIEEEKPKSILDKESIFHSREDFTAKYPPSNPAVYRQAWLEDLSATKNDNSNEMIQLHPDVWAIRPRLDIINDNLEWQKWYKRIDWEYVKDRYEMEYRQTRRPWPQKGTGRARHRTETSPIWLQGKIYKVTVHDHMLHMLLFIKNNFYFTFVFWLYS